jgi:hypothetical protein
MEQWGVSLSEKNVQSSLFRRVLFLKIKAIKIMKNKNKIIIAFVFVVFLLWIGWGVYRGVDLKNNFVITIGHIDKISRPGWKSSGDYAIIYSYNIQGRIFKGDDAYNYCGYLNNEQSVAELIVGKSFPVAYSTKENGYSVVILTKEIAKNFDYNISDSLLVYDSILTCK